MVVYPYKIIIKNSDVLQVRKLNVDAMLVGCFQVVEHMSWKYIVTSLSISRRPLKERICSPASKLFHFRAVISRKDYVVQGSRQNVAKFVPT